MNYDIRKDARNRALFIYNHKRRLETVVFFSFTIIRQRRAERKIKMKGKSEIIVNGLKPTNLVEKSYPLLMMKQVPFSLGELKILDTYLSRINARNVESRTVSFSKAEYESLMGIERMRPERLAKYVDSMMGKIVTLPEGNGWRKYVLFTSSRCYKREDNDEWWIDIICSSEAKKFFFNIEGIGYLKYQLKNTLSLKSVNSLLLYWYLRANVFRGTWSIDITELRESVFRCYDEYYKDFKYFRRNYIEKSLKDINEKTDLSFSFSVEKKNRRADKVCFEILRDDSPFLYTEKNQIGDETGNLESEDEDISLLSQACNNEFSLNEMKNIRLALQQRCFNEENKNNIHFLFNFLCDCYDELIVQSSKQVIHSRYDYLRGIIENY